MQAKPYLVEQAFNGRPVLFRSDGWVSATHLAEVFAARVDNFMRLDATKRYIATLERYLARRLNSLTSEVVSKVDVFQTIEGRRGGTWFHPLLAVEFARWLDPEFSIWCNEIVLEVMGGRLVTPESARRLWARHTSVELIGWCQEVMVQAAPPGVHIKEIRGSATEIRDMLTSRGRACPPANWLGRWLTDLKVTHGEEVAEFSRGHARREWVVRARPRLLRDA